MSLLDDLRTFFLGDDGAMHEYRQGPWVKAIDVREALLAHLDELRQDDEDGHPPTVAYNEALDDVRRWAGGDDGPRANPRSPMHTPWAGDQ